MEAILIKYPKQSANILYFDIDEIKNKVTEILGKNIECIEFHESTILYNADARKRGEQFNTIVSGVSLMGPLICLQSFGNKIQGLSDHQIKAFNSYLCFIEQPDISVDKFI